MRSSRRPSRTSAERVLLGPGILGVPLATLTLLGACEDERRPPPPPDVAASMQIVDGSLVPDAARDGEGGLAKVGDGGAANDGAPQVDFYRCKVDKDCVAVPKVGCCANGYLEAVRGDRQEPYRASFTCPTPDQICPHFKINDVRLPECNPQSGTCELVAPHDIRCGGKVADPHACPDGSTCEAADAAAPGHCT